MLRTEYPRPMLKRESEWKNLNGTWQVEFDDADEGLKERWWETKTRFSQTIQVPFTYESSLSGLELHEDHKIMWYKRDFHRPNRRNDQRALIHFGAVDYACTVWVNGHCVGSHEGGYTPFSFDVTSLLLESEANHVVVRVEDDPFAMEQPRGKQTWRAEPFECFYTRTTGIWQSVWIEMVPDCSIAKLKMDPDIDKGVANIQVVLDGVEKAISAGDWWIEVKIDFEGLPIATERKALDSTQLSFNTVLKDNDKSFIRRLWSPDNPNLHHVVVSILDSDGSVVDRIQTHLGLRKIHCSGDKVFLNNSPCMMKLILDQGYFPEGNLTARSEQDIIRDIELVKSMGFTGVRKHQKIEDPLFLYWCDKLGLLVWEEMPSAYEFSLSMRQRIRNQWLEVIQRDYNHPSIVAWVVMNESWGVPNLQSDPMQSAFLSELYFLTKAEDPSRLVVSNDGWEHTISDLCTIHDYSCDFETLQMRYGDSERAVRQFPAGKSVYALGYTYAGQPILLSECGGASMEIAEEDQDGWGYSEVRSADELVRRYQDIVQVVKKSGMSGFCYTQLTDVQQEVNGLLTFDRVPKIDLSVIKSINDTI